MINTNLLTVKNFIVVAIFAVIWQIMLSKTTNFLHTQENVTQ